MDARTVGIIADVENLAKQGQHEMAVIRDLIAQHADALLALQSQLDALREQVEGDHHKKSKKEKD